MRLIKCYIENFGKLQQIEHTFSQGLNIIKEENGFGKTTFATFIKSMFYGLETSTRVANSDRKKYKPWQGGMFGGNIEFELNNKRYRIERFFGNKATEDTFKLYDLETGLESKEYSENIGEEIFKINKNAYERSTYIPQGQIQIEMEDSISAKLGNVLESENDVNTSEEAIKRITESMKIYKKTGGKGLLNEKRNKLNQLQRDLESSKFDEQNLEIRKSKLEEKNKEIKQIEQLREQKQKALAKKIEQGRKLAKQETFNNILTKLKENEEKFNKLNEFFKSGVPTDEKLNELYLKSLEIEKSKVEIQSNDLFEEEKNNLEKLFSKFAGKDVAEEEINQKIIYCSKVQEINSELQKLEIDKNNIKQEIEKLEESKKKNSKNSKIFSGLGLVVILLGTILLALKIQPIVGMVTIAVGIVGIVISILKNKNKYVEKNYNEEKEKLQNIEKQLTELVLNKEVIDSKINNLLNIYANDIEQKGYQEKILELTNLKAEYSLYKDLKNKKDNKDKLKEQAKIKKETLETSLKQDLLNYFKEVSENNFSELIQELRIQKNELNNSIEELEKSKRLKEEYEKANNIEELKTEENIENIDENAITEEIKTLGIKLDRLNDEKNQYKNQIEILENKVDENEYIETDIENLKEEIENLDKKYDILEKTKKYLETAKETFSSNYLKDMVDGFNEYLDLIDDKQLETSVDINLDVKIDVNGSKREIKNFSTGYKDLVYICMRFSLIKALFKDEKPFVILDDPFVNLDEVKTKKAIELINKLAVNNQIIYFVCNNSRV